eukprot:TRINITY_DN14970_c0_g1_i1.p1 TRINITY_DN14970_c0_g1~~TRINITY_DN14970_c0_g1_i1.p1  ORF type:complete len:761 (-),score=106.71 TRINITY_DN14970_c0_g1_i1:16-2298(-)
MSGDVSTAPFVDKENSGASVGTARSVYNKSHQIGVENEKHHAKAPLGVHVSHGTNGEGAGGVGANLSRNSAAADGNGNGGAVPKFDPETAKAQVSLLRSRLASLGGKKTATSQITPGGNSQTMPSMPAEHRPSPHTATTPSAAHLGQQNTGNHTHGSASKNTPTNAITPSRGNGTSLSSSGASIMRPDDHHPKRHDLARTAEAWWEYLVEQYKTGAASPDDLLILTQNTIFPQLEPEKASLRDNDSYLNIWLLFAKLQPQAQDGLEERHQIYQRMYQDRIGRKNASLYLNWLHFEAKQNHSSCIRDVLRLALKNEAEPVMRIHEFMSQSGISMSDLGEIRKSQQFAQTSVAQPTPATPSATLSIPVAQPERPHVSQRESMEGVHQYGDKRASFQSSAPVNHHPAPQALQTPTQQSLHTSSNRSSQSAASQSQRSSAVESKLAELRNKWTQASQLLNMGVMVVRGTPYLNLGRIGNGGSSKVYKVLSAANMQIYAVKVVNLVDQDESVIRQYINEVALLKDFTSRAMEARQRMRDNPQSPPYNHNIIELIDFEHNKEKKMLLIVLEFAEIDLHKLLKNYGGHLVNNLNLLRYYWEGMLRAVQTVHEHRIVHSDLKPPNFVVVKGQVKLIDFGIAKAISQNTTNIVRQDIIGTMNYMAPEAIGCVGSSSKALKVGRPADVWALGCILYQMVYGAPPFAHIENMLQKLQVIGNPSYKIDFPTHSHNIPVPEQLIEVMMSCLQRESKERPTIPELLQHSMLKSM